MITDTLCTFFISDHFSCEAFLRLSQLHLYNKRLVVIGKNLPQSFSRFYLPV
ncbi:hypothetical protein BFO_2167 [Tannerella forsythia 92A2]|uniref:Uncharacterized protein n=1 Tax=Tannerella forsythia (strain ATCC 43037 / JCM 10827 / CCUG 21028 A / KCTC 5666 / FDC 338) TaxID=203275 RepID=G8UIL8_TANFA|nr:hypothetical protein BFO_2167 [Tannerella forsythia 92A2]